MRRKGIAAAAAAALWVLAATGIAGAAPFEGAVATVGGETVQAAELREELKDTTLRHRTMGNSPREAFELALRQVLRRRLVLLDVSRRKLLDGELGDRYKAVEIPAIAMVFRALEVKRQVVTDQEMTAAMPLAMMERRKVRYMASTSEEDMRAALARARAGEDFAALVQQYSEGPGAESGGDLGWLEKGSNRYFTEEHWESILSLPEGGVTECFPTLLFEGCAIAKVEQIQQYGSEEVDAIRESNRSVLQERKMTEEIDALVSGAKVTVKEGVLKRLATADRTEILAAFTGGHVTVGVFRSYLGRMGIKAADADIKQLPDQLRSFMTLAVVAAAKGKRVVSDPEVAAGFRQGSQDSLFKLYFDPIFEKVAVTDEQVARYFREHPDENSSPERVDLWQIRTITKVEAEEALRRLKQGADFEEVATLYAATDQERQQAGHVGEFKRANFAEPIADIIFSLHLMELSRPVGTRFGYYIYQVRKKIPGISYTLQQRSADIRRKLVEEGQSKAFSDIIEKLEKTYPVKVDHAALDKM